MSNTARPSSLLMEKGVHLIGDFFGQSSLCQSGRDVRDIIQSLGVPVEVLDLPLSTERVSKSGKLDFSEVEMKPPQSPVTIINWNADALPSVVSRLPKEFLKNRFIVGIWYWETEIFPESHARGFDYVDEVWVLSKFIRDSLAKSSPVPVRNFPCYARSPKLPARMVFPEPLRNDRFVFLFCFDYNSVVRRKNPESFCKAFIKAFPEDKPDGPLCVVKSVSGKSHHTLEYVQLRREFMHRRDIIFIDGWLPVEERDCLMARAGCYVSLHRSEGLGLTLLESMALGKPCIATAYSGNMDFSTAENSWLIPFKMVPVGPWRWPYPQEHLWADPDLDAAAAAMREAFGNPTLLAEKGRLSQESVRAHHCAEAVGDELLQLLEKVITSPPRPKPWMESPPSAVAGDQTQTSCGRLNAREWLKKSKAAEKLVRKKVKDLSTIRLPKKAKNCMEKMLELIRMHEKTHAEMLRELSAVKKRLHGFHGPTFDSLVRDRDLNRKIHLATLEAPGMSGEDA